MSFMYQTWNTSPIKIPWLLFPYFHLLIVVASVQIGEINNSQQQYASALLSFTCSD